MSLSPQAASGFWEAFSLLARQFDCKTEVPVLENSDQFFQAKAAKVLYVKSRER